jgi:hypothetical protein
MAYAIKLMRRHKLDPEKLFLRRDSVVAGADSLAAKILEAAGPGVRRRGKGKPPGVALLIRFINEQSSRYSDAPVAKEIAHRFAQIAYLNADPTKALGLSYPEGGQEGSFKLKPELVAAVRKHLDKEPLSHSWPPKLVRGALERAYTAAAVELGLGEDTNAIGKDWRKADGGDYVWIRWLREQLGENNSP